MEKLLGKSSSARIPLLLCSLELRYLCNTMDEPIYLDVHAPSSSLKYWYNNYGIFYQ